MGFDNECILNIQSLAGEYFCPVCRLLVYPNEALQSQCTHLYCKPCLTYVVSTTRACPYDGYLVTEADAKPLIESNKTLAETIGKIMVHCLYHRSGCTWEGPLSECTSHCSGCSFGNSAVVCNRCGIQIVHRQVQEHAQNCPVVQTQVHGEGTQEAAATGTTSAGDHPQAATQVGTSVTQAQPSQIMASSVQAHDQSQQQQANPTTQSQSSVQGAVPTAEQWYQQQQQYQQYYQQYAGYDPYQQQYQQYYPYQQPAAAQQAYMQPAAAQPQPQVQSQVPLQTQPQSHLHIQQPATQPQSQPLVNSQQQTHSTTQPQPQMQSQTHLAPLGQQNPQAAMHPQTHPVQPHPQVHMPPYQQPQSQMQHQSQVHTQNPVAQPLSQGLPQTYPQQPAQPPPQSLTPQSNQLVNPHLQSQPQYSSSHAVTGHHSYPQFQSQQQMRPGGAHLYPQGGIQPQSQHSVQIQNQFLQQAPPSRPPQSHVPIQNPQQSGLYPSPGQVPNAPPQQQPVHSHVNQPGVPVPQRPVMQSVQPPSHLQYVQQQQQPFPGQALGSVQSHVHQQGAYAHQHPHVQSQLRPQGQQPSHAYPHPYQNVALPHGMQPHQTQNLGGRPMASPNGVPAQPHPYSSVSVQGKSMQVGTGQQSGNAVMTNNPMLSSSEQHLGVTLRSFPERQGNNNLERGLEAESSSLNNNKRNAEELEVPPGPGPDADASEVKKAKTESGVKSLNDESKPINEVKDASKSPVAENGVHLLREVKDEPADGNSDQKDVSVADNKQAGRSISEDKESQGAHLLNEGNPIEDQRKQQPPSIPHGLTALQRPVEPSSLQAPPTGSSHYMQFPDHASGQMRPFGPGNIPHLGQPMNSLPEHLQQPSHKQPHGPEMPPAIGGPGSTSNFGRGHSHYESDMFLNQRSNYADDRRLDPLGQQPGKHSSAIRMNGAPGIDSSLGPGLRDDRWRPLPEEHMNPFHQDPTRRIFERGEFEEDLKHFPRPSDLDNESVRKFGGRFLPSRPLDKGSAPSRFFSPYHHDGVMHPNEIGERPIGLNEKTAGGKPDPARNHDRFGPVSRYDMAPRSPHRDYTGVSSHRFGDDFDGRESHRFGDLLHGSRFPILPSHLHRGEFEGPVQEGFPSHLRRGEHFGPHNLPGHLGEPIGFDGPGNFFHQQLGEPGYRSNFSLKGFPGDSGSYPGDFESLDNLRRRKPSSMGWCRICKLDCETVEGLDLHSQTREHQKKAMDMVLTIKQNAKKQKIASIDRSSLDDVSKSRNSSFEGVRKKN